MDFKKTIQLGLHMLALCTMAFYALGDELQTEYSQQNVASNKVSLPALIKGSDDIATRYAELNWFSGNVLLASQDKVVFHQSYGYANTAEALKNSACTRFNIGSIAKHYTAVLVLQLIEEGKLTFDTPLSRFELDLDDALTQGVTIEHLLNHQAGFADIFTPEYMADPLSFDTLDKKIALLKDTPRLFEPGTDYRYSNYGYILLGRIAEMITQKSFATLLNERIFTPIGAKHSSLTRLDNSPCQSTRYTFTIEWQLAPSLLQEVSGPDGGIEATAPEVYQFYHALVFTDTLLKHKGPVFSRYFRVRDNKIVSYGGGTGISAAAEVLVDQGIVIVVLANSDELVAERISNRITQLATTGNYDAIKPPPKHFVYQQYRTLGPADFKTQFKQQYNDAQYTTFMGKALNESALALIRQGNAQAGLDIIATLIHHYPDAPQVYDSLAFAHHLLGNAQQARDAFQQALALRADFNSDYHPTNYQ